MTQRRFPAEWEEHERVFLAWPASSDFWGGDLAYVRDDVAGIARALAEFEPVVVLARPGQADAARYACGGAVEVINLPVDDLWTRDTAPVFVEDDGGIAGVDLNFNGWGGKQRHKGDASVAGILLARYQVPKTIAQFVAEGGALETDGEGTLLATESSLVNDNRNPRRTRDDLERMLKETLGVQKVIWFPGVRGRDVTDAHVDFLARFAAPGLVLVNRPARGTQPDVWTRCSDKAMDILAAETDAQGRPFQIVELPEPDPLRISGRGDAFLASYANFYLANGAVLVPRFGDRQADDKARQILQDYFPDRVVVPLTIDTLATGGGGIHCATHDQPRYSPRS